MLVEIGDNGDAGGGGLYWECWWRWVILGMLVEVGDTGDAGGDW